MRRSLFLFQHRYRSVTKPLIYAQSQRRTIISVSYTHLDVYKRQILTLAVLDTRQTALFHLTATQIPVTKADESPADLSEIDAGDIVLLPWNGVMRGEPPYALTDVTNIVRTDSARMSTYQLQIVASLPNEALAFRCV